MALFYFFEFTPSIRTLSSDCIWDWKSEIFLSQNPQLVETYNNIKVDNVRLSIQKWLDEQNIYPELNSDEEYSFYAEKAYPIKEDRWKCFQRLITSKSPSLGYHLISMLAKSGMIKSVWTTNFDGLMLKCAHQYDICPIEITSETSERIYRGDVVGELLCIALHGDYKYGPLKNTSEELDSQNDVLINALSYEMTNRDLIVIGYSGRDESLMKALETALQNKGSGKLFWCGYGETAPKAVEKLIHTANNAGRAAYYIPTDGFDKTVYILARHCMNENKNFLYETEKLKTKLSNAVNISTSKFRNFDGKLNKITKTNLFPILFPQFCFQFEVHLKEGERLWGFCKLLYRKGIMAVPYNGFIYAWGEKSHIQKLCSNKLKSNISVTPLTLEALYCNSVFKELLLKTIASLMGEYSSLKYSKNKVWDPSQKISCQIGNQSFSAFKGIRIALVFIFKHVYLAITPALTYEIKDDISKEVKKQLSDSFNINVNGSKPNYNVHGYVKKWVEKVIGASGLSVSYPLNSHTGFDFKVVPKTAVLGISCGNTHRLKIPQSISEKRIVFNGIECCDPELSFYSTLTRKAITDFHPMRGLVKHAPFDYLLNDEVLRSSISLGVISPDNHNKKFSDFVNQLNSKHSVKFNVDFVIPFPGFYQAFKAALQIPNPSSNKWQSLLTTQNSDMKRASIELGNLITRKLDQLSALSTDVVLIYIPKEYESLTGYEDSNEKFDLHDYVKAYAAQKNIATQFVRERTIESDLNCQIMWALSLAIYVKSSRIPWVVSGIQSDTAFAGIGYSVERNSHGTNIVVGCSHIYSSDGQGMKYKLSKINDVSFDYRKNPFLSEDEAFKLGLNIKELFYKSFTELPKRVVIHKRTQFRKGEVKGLVESLSSAGIKDIELLEITYEDDIKCFEFNRNTTDIDGFPVRRGLCFPLNDNTMYLFTHGIAPSVQDPNRKYIQGGKTIPLPLKIVKHYGNGSMTQIASEILGLSKMNWNSFGLYSKLPCTIESSNAIAKIGRLLSQYEGVIYDYRYFM